MPRTIPEIPLVLVPETAEAKSVVGFKWAEPEIGKRSKIGGTPAWVSEDQTPLCSCRERMTLYAQLDSIGDSVCLADAGMIYVFVCFDCFETKSVLQSS